eukprot:43064-Prorocentrum_minimum.AAC.4
MVTSRGGTIASDMSMSTCKGASQALSILYGPNEARAVVHNTQQYKCPQPKRIPTGVAPLSLTASDYAGIHSQSGLRILKFGDPPLGRWPTNSVSGLDTEREVRTFSPG